MLVAFTRYSQDQAFRVLCDKRGFVVAMTLGSIAGTISGGLLLGVVPDAVLVPILVALLVVSAVRVAQHVQTAH